MRNILLSLTIIAGLGSPAVAQDIECADTTDILLGQLYNEYNEIPVIIFENDQESYFLTLENTSNEDALTNGATWSIVDNVTHCLIAFGNYVDAGINPEEDFVYFELFTDQSSVTLVLYSGKTFWEVYDQGLSVVAMGTSWDTIEIE